MWKTVMFTFLKYCVYIICIAVLISVLAKTHNMPAAVPEKYVQKIIEITDRVLISFNLIHDEQVKARYYRTTQVSKEKSEAHIISRIERNFFSKALNLLLFNGYDLAQEKNLNMISAEWEKRVKKSLQRLNSLSENPYIRSAILESETGIIDYYTANFLNSIIKEMKMIAGFIIKDNERLIKFIKNENVNLSKEDIKELKDTTPNNYNISYITINNTPYLLYNYFSSDRYNIQFILFPEYFSNIPYEIFPSENLFVFDNNYRIISTKISEPHLFKQIKSSLLSKEFFYNNESYKIVYIKSPGIENYYVGIYYKKYPLWKTILNIFKVLIFLAGIIIIGFLIKFLINRFSLYKTRAKSDELDLMTGAMMEVAKSIRLAADAAEKASQLAKFESSNVQNVVNELKKSTATFNVSQVIEDGKSQQIQKKDEEWEFIE